MKQLKQYKKPPELGVAPIIIKEDIIPKIIHEDYWGPSLKLLFNVKEFFKSQLLWAKAYLYI